MHFQRRTMRVNPTVIAASRFKILPGLFTTLEVENVAADNFRRIAWKHHTNHRWKILKGDICFQKKRIISKLLHKWCRLLWQESNLPQEGHHRVLGLVLKRLNTLLRSSALSIMKAQSIPAKTAHTPADINNVGQLFTSNSRLYKRQTSTMGMTQL